MEKFEIVDGDKQDFECRIQIFGSFRKRWFSNILNQEIKRRFLKGKLIRKLMFFD